MLEDSGEKYFNSDFLCLQETSGKGQTEQQQRLFLYISKVWFLLIFPFQQ